MTGLKTYIKSIPAAEIFLNLLFLCLFLLFFDFSSSLGITYISLPFKVVSAIADSALLVIMCMFLKGRWKAVGIVIVFAIALLLLSNLLYYRNFEDIIQASAYLHAEISDSTVIEGAISSLQYSDLFFIIIPFLPLAYIIKEGRKIRKSSATPSWRLCISVVFIVSWSVSYAGVFRRRSLSDPDATIKEIAESVFSKETVTWRGVYEMHNFTGYLVKCIFIAHDIGMRLTPSDIYTIKSHLSTAYQNRPNSQAISITHENKKNLIMIIVESLPFKILEIPEATELTPNLMNITADSTTIISKCMVLTGYGRSSDAQFLYNTGLLPLKHEALVDNYADNDYPSLAKALGKRSMEIIGERKGLWNHSHTTKSYGFGSLMDGIAPDGMNQDSIIFKSAEKVVSMLRSPFFLFVTTISMHDPYDEARVTLGDKNTRPLSFDSRDGEYYARLQHFDRSLGRFLWTLRQKGIYDDSVIVILGDHEIRASKISASLHDDYVPFIIINSPLKSTDCILSTQLDVFPTVLDLMNCQYRYLGVDYSGLGRSIFSEDIKTDRPYIPTDADYRISEMIIKGSPSKFSQH